jgi:hypothetical protein
MDTLVFDTLPSVVQQCDDRYFLSLGLRAKLSLKAWEDIFDPPLPTNEFLEKFNDMIGHE